MPEYSKAELRAKGEEIIDEAVLATEREQESLNEAYEDMGEHGNPSADNTLMENIEGYVRDQLSWIPDALEGMADPEPDGFEDLIEKCDEIYNYVTPNGAGTSPATNADELQTSMGQWEGLFAQSMSNRVISPLSKIAANHEMIADVLQRSSKGIKAVYRAKRVDVSDMCDKTIEALKACGDKDGTEVKMGLVVLGAIVGVAGAAVTGGASIALAVAGAGISIGSEAIPEGDDNGPELGAPTVNEVIGNMIDAMSKINETVSDEEQKACELLDANYEILTSSRSITNGQTGADKVSELVPIRPQGTDDPGASVRPI